MFSFRVSGSTSRTESYLEKMLHMNVDSILEAAGHAGVTALETHTPEDSGLAANSWTYEIERSEGAVKVVWHNTDIESGFPVALMIQYGHGTGTGGYIPGRDYVNPAIEPIFQKIAEDIRKAVSS